MIRTVLFDLDDTILDFKRAEGIALREALRRMGLEPTDNVVSRYSVINRRQWELLEDKVLTRERVLVRRFELLFEEFNIAADAQQAQHLFHSLLSKGHYFLPGAEDMLQTLKDRYDLYIVSNGTAAVQFPRIESAQLAPFFKEIFISELIGFDKPDVRFFEYCFERIPGFKKEEAIVIGDSLTSDIRGGNNAGLVTCWFNPSHAPEKSGIHADYQVDALDQIPVLLAQL